MVCTFFGHRDSPSYIYPQLKAEITNLIKNENVNTFYVGNHGDFDNMAISALKEITKEFTHIRFYVVLAYMPTQSSEYPTILPDGIENTIKKCAIEYRNKWMIENSDFAITYIERNFGGAAKFANIAIKKCKKTINLANM